MTKIPVGATIAQAYTFVFQKFSRLLVIVWLPVSIMLAAGWLLMPQSATVAMAIASHNYTNIASALAFLIPFYLGTLVLLCITLVGVAEEVLGLRRTGSFYYFSLGKPVWKLIGAFLILVPLVVALWFAGLIVGVLVSIFVVFVGALASLPQSEINNCAIAGLLLVYGTIFFGLVRMTFLLLPVVVAEKKISLKRSWQLGRKNSWRMFAILLSALLPFMMLEGIFMVGFLWHGFPPVPPPHATGAQITTASANMTAWNAAMTARMTGYWFITYPFFAVISVLFYGLWAASQSFAYRARIADEIDTGVL